MNFSINATDRTRAVLVILATIGTVTFNWMASIGLVNGVTPEIVSDKYPTLITPAGYAFTIWSLIYLGLIVFSLYQALQPQAERLRPIRSLYVLSCFLNCAWIYLWHSEAILGCMVVIAALCLTLLAIASRVKDSQTNAEVWLIKAPFGLYLGWVTAASLVNLAVLLLYEGKMPLGNGALWFGLAIVVFAAVIGVLGRIKLRNSFVPLAIAWALTAIAVKQSRQTEIVVALVAGVVVCLIASLSFVMNLNSSTSE